MECYKGYIDKGYMPKEYPNVWVKNFSSLEEFKSVPKHGVAVSTDEICKTNSLTDSGCVISTLDDNPGRAFRTIKGINFYEYMPFLGAKVHDILSPLQKDIKLTEFPKYLLTINNIPVGEEIVYYPNHIALYDYVTDDWLEKHSFKEIYQIYFAILDILLELDKLNIVYEDIHGGNFLVNPDDLSIKLIDFEWPHVFIGNYKKTMLSNLKNLINYLNQQIGLTFSDPSFLNGNDLNEVKRVLEKENKNR